MLFRTWADAVATRGYPFFKPATQSEIYFAELAGRVVPSEKPRIELRVREVSERV